MRSKFYLSLILLLPFSSFAVSKASFDCSKASTPIEKKICSSEKLSELDRAIAEKYKSASTQLNAADKKAKQEEQKAWNASREKTCKDLQVSCLINLMNERVSALSPSNKTSWPESCFKGDEQILCISQCDANGCSYEFAGVQNAPCEAKGKFAFSPKDKTTGIEKTKIEKKDCTTEFTLSKDRKLIEVGASCSCNQSLDGADIFDLSGEYKSMD